MSPTHDAPASKAHDERLWPGPLGWGFVVGFAVLVLISLLPVHPILAVVVAAGSLVVAVVAAVRTSTRVLVHAGELRVGRAHIPTALLGEIEVLDRAGVRAAVGPGSDARDHVCLRAWIPGGVRVVVEDPADPTPAWVVSSRRADELATAIRSSQAAHSEQIG